MYKFLTVKCTPTIKTPIFKEKIQGHGLSVPDGRYTALASPDGILYKPKSDFFKSYK